MTDKKLTKNAGEHWVCSVLARCGWSAALTRDALERTDILAVHTEGDARTAIEVQVKTATWVDDMERWRLGKNDQKPARSRFEWYALVILRPDAPTSALRTFFVPRDHVAAAAWIGHRDWLADKSVPPGTRNADMNWSRVKPETFEAYEDGFDWLDTPTDEVPVMLPERYRKLALDPEVGLPDKHPWKTSLPEW